MSKNIFLLPLLLLTLSACSSGGGGIAEVQPNPSCTTITNYPSGVTITGSAAYQYRTNGNGAVSPTTNPIRQAEIVVYNAANLIIQCGATDDSGNFSVVVPQASGLVLRINSRIYNSFTKVLVLNDLANKRDHYVQVGFNASANTNIGTLTAEATGDVIGGAFNILDKILTANKYLESTTANCSSSFANCPPVTTIPQLLVFWKKGFDPGEYISALSPVSYYLRNDRELYILGGDGGDVNNSDTDHFDTSIILHEYGHFIEDVFSVADSPVGNHNGNIILDPRLAWGEGWATFFQAAVTQVPVYRDTSGNIEGVASVYFNESLETPNHDIPSTTGEGNFREFSISRLLWDAIDSNNHPGDAGDTVTSPFSEVWTTLANTANGFANTSYRFRTIGLFHQIHQSIGGVVDWTPLFTLEKQRPNRTDYGSEVVRSGGACVTPYPAIQAANISGSEIENGTFVLSNQFASNDFYQYYHSGGLFQVSLSFTNSDANNPSDLDLYVFEDRYFFSATDETVAGRSTNRNGVNPVASGSESVTANLPAGYYMINVHAYTGVALGASATYTMTLNGANLCLN